MKGWWKSNINAWFPFMYFQKWNCAASLFPKQSYNVLSQKFLHSYICESFIYFQDRSVYFAAAKYVDRSWVYINRSQTHECANWDWGRPIPRKGIHKWDFLLQCAAFLDNYTSESFSYGKWSLCLQVMCSCMCLTCLETISKQGIGLHGPGYKKRSGGVERPHGVMVLTMD